jgi:hypothetical protein
MSLLEKIALVEILVAEIKELIGTPALDIPVVPWYENIPAGGVLCWRSDCMEDLYNQMRDAARGDACRIYDYYAGVQRPFQHCCWWKYAIPVDPALRLPNGAITL